MDGIGSHFTTERVKTGHSRPAAARTRPRPYLEFCARNSATVPTAVEVALLILGERFELPEETELVAATPRQRDAQDDEGEARGEENAAGSGHYLSKFTNR